MSLAYGLSMTKLDLGQTNSYSFTTFFTHFRPSPSSSLCVQATKRDNNDNPMDSIRFIAAMIIKEHGFHRFSRRKSPFPSVESVFHIVP